MVYFLNASNSKTMRLVHEEHNPTVLFKGLEKTSDDWQDFQKYLRESTLNYGVVLLDNTQAGKLIKFRAPENQAKFRISQ